MYRMCTSALKLTYFLLLQYKKNGIQIKEAEI